MKGLEGWDTTDEEDDQQQVNCDGDESEGEANYEQENSVVGKTENLETSFPSKFHDVKFQSMKADESEAAFAELSASPAFRGLPMPVVPRNSKLQADASDGAALAQSSAVSPAFRDLSMADKVADVPGMSRVTQAGGHPEQKKQVNLARLEQCRIYKASRKVLLDCRGYYNHANINKLQEIIVDGAANHLEQMLQENLSAIEEQERKCTNSARLLMYLENLLNELPAMP